jgi:hypothetical protein
LRDIVLNAHAPTEDKRDDTKDNLYEELERVFDQFLTYYMNSSLRNFNADVGMEDIFTPTIGNESLHEFSKVNGVIVVNYVIQKESVTLTSTLHIVTR